MGPVRQALVAATRDAHEALHRHERIVPLMGQELTVAIYRDLLMDYFTFYGGVEAQRRSAGRWPALSLEPLLGALRSDLSDLGAPRLRARHDDRDCRGRANGVRATGLKLASDEAALGALYVLHGASFGASVIGTSVERALPNVPRRFFSHPRGLAARWRQLLADLERTGKPPRNRAAIVAGADATFLHFGTFLSSAGSFAPLQSH